MWLFELQEHDEVGEDDGDGGGEGGPVRREQPVPRHRLQVLHGPHQLPALKILGGSPQCPEARVQLVDFEEEKLHQQKKCHSERNKSELH